MAILTRRFILICLVFAIFAMVLAAAVASADQTRGYKAIRFCSSSEGTACLLDRS